MNVIVLRLSGVREWSKVTPLPLQSWIPFQREESWLHKVSTDMTVTFPKGKCSRSFAKRVVDLPIGCQLCIHRVVLWAPTDYRTPWCHPHNSNSDAINPFHSMFSGIYSQRVKLVLLMTSRTPNLTSRWPCDYLLNYALSWSQLQPPYHPSGTSTNTSLRSQSD